MKKITLLLLGLTLLSCVTTNNIERKRARIGKLNYRQLQREQGKIKEKNTVNIENVLFEKDEMFSAVDKDRNILAYYDRVKNKNFILLKGIQLYDKDMNPVYTLLPAMDIAQKEALIYIKDLKNDRTGRIKYSLEIDFPKISYDVDVNLFGEIYDCRLIYKTELGRFSASTAFFYEGDIVMYQNSSYSPTGADIDEIVTDDLHMQEEGMNLTLLAFSMKLFDEIQMEILRSFLPDWAK